MNQSLSLYRGNKSVTQRIVVMLLALGVAAATAGEIGATADVGQPGPVANSPASGVSTSKSSPTGASNLNVDGLDALTDKSIVNDRIGTVLNNVSQNRARTSRGVKEAQIYQKYASAVVLIVTEDGLGSGVLIDKKGLIITNWHVVGKNKQVGVVFKPKAEGQAPQKADVRLAKVLRVDEVSDLALVQVGEVPADIDPMQLGDMSEVAVGNDVHAIGHPTGESWTYTKGFVSQIRNDYRWTGGKDGAGHQANVIQTQTPINPGNSGGPLISDSGRLVGINSFKSSGEALNFAVAVDEVKRFVSSNQSRLAKAPEAGTARASASNTCKPKQIDRFDSKDGSADVIVFDIRCDGKRTAFLVTPYDIRKPITLDLDEAGIGKISGRIVDTDRDGKWDVSVWDTKGNGVWDVICSQKNGTLEVDRCEPYKKKG